MCRAGRGSIDTFMAVATYRAVMTFIGTRTRSSPRPLASPAASVLGLIGIGGPQVFGPHLVSRGFACFARPSALRGALWHALPAHAHATRRVVLARHIVTFALVSAHVALRRVPAARRQ